MVKMTGWIVSVCLLAAGSGVLANPPGKSKGKTARLQEVWTCPVSGAKVTDKKSKTAVVGNYRVHFCCDSCPQAFAKLSAKEKRAKAAEAAKKDKASARKPKEVAEATPEAPAEEAVKDVWVCPISGQEVRDREGARANAVVVGNYRVHFCCDGCPSAFAKLSEAEKLEKAEAAAKKN